MLYCPPSQAGEAAALLAHAYGFDRIGNLLVINNDEQKVIEDILELRQKWWSLRGVASKLNQVGVESKRGGQRFGSTVRSIIECATRYE